MHQNVPSFEEVVREIDTSLAEIDDSKTSQLGLAAISGPQGNLSTEKYLLFSFGNRLIAVAVTGIAEVGDMPKVTRLPSVPSWVLGIANIHNEIISVIDLERFMKWEVTKASAPEKMVVLGLNDLKVAIGISRIMGTHIRTIDQEFAESTTTDKEYSKHFFKETMVVADQRFHILDSKSLLTNKRFILCNA